VVAVAYLHEFETGSQPSLPSHGATIPAKRATGDLTTMRTEEGRAAVTCPVHSTASVQHAMGFNGGGTLLSQEATAPEVSRNVKSDSIEREFCFPAEMSS
jgi:hypothetical protein